MDAIYTVLVILHVLSAIAAIGAWFALLVLMSQLRQRPQGAPALLPAMARIAMFPRHGGFALLLTGVAMVAYNGWSQFREPWIALSLALLLVMIGGGLAVIAPRLKAFGGLVARGAPTAETGPALQALVQFGLIMVVLGIIITVLMVTKVGS